MERTEGLQTALRVQAAVERVHHHSPRRVGRSTHARFLRDQPVGGGSLGRQHSRAWRSRRRGRSPWSRPRRRPGPEGPGRRRSRERGRAASLPARRHVRGAGKPPPLDGVRDSARPRSCRTSSSWPARRNRAARCRLVPTAHDTEAGDAIIIGGNERTLQATSERRAMTAALARRGTARQARGGARPRLAPAPALPARAPRQRRSP